MASLNTNGANRIELNYGHRVWTARIWLLEAISLAPGSQANLDLGDGVTMTGTVMRGSAYQARAVYTVIGGNGAWKLPISPVALKRSDSGVRLHTALDVIVTTQAAAANASNGLARPETVNVTTADRILGKTWVPATAPGTEQLDRLLPMWYVSRDGTTVLGPPSGTPILAENYAIGDYDPVGKRALVHPRDDDGLNGILDSLGSTISGDPFDTPLTVNAIRVVVSEAGTMVWVTE